MRALAAAAALLVVPLLAGCSEDEPAHPVVTEQEDRWNPCDGLDAERTSAVLGAPVRMESEDGQAPRCALVPAEEGGATFDVTYLLFDGGLDAAWSTIADSIPEEAVTRPEVRGADDARLVVDVTRRVALVTGFVENGDLIQTVNAADLRPYDQRTLLRTTRALMADLAAHAEERGVGSE